MEELRIIPPKPQAPPGAVEFKVGVYRWMPDTTAENMKVRHDARRDELAAELVVADGFYVQDWGDTFDKQPHEFVEIVIAVVSTGAVSAVAGSVLEWLGKRLAEKAVDESVTAGFKVLARRIFRMQKTKKVFDIEAKAPDGTSVLLAPPEWGGRAVARIWFVDGSSVDFHPPPDGWTGDPQLDPDKERIRSR